MIEHLVLFQFQLHHQDKIDSAILGLRQLREKIPQIVQLSAGRNFCDRSQGFEFGLRVLVNSREDLQAYAAHPEHLKVVEDLIVPYKVNILALDYEC